METTQEQFSRDKSVSAAEIFRVLIETDNLLSSFEKLPADIQKREKYFAINSIKGIIDYINPKNDLYLGF